MAIKKPAAKKAAAKATKKTASKKTASKKTTSKKAKGASSKKHWTDEVFVAMETLVKGYFSDMQRELEKMHTQVNAVFEKVKDYHAGLDTKLDAKDKGISGEIEGLGKRIEKMMDEAFKDFKTRNQG